MTPQEGKNERRNMISKGGQLTLAHILDTLKHFCEFKDPEAVLYNSL